MRKIPRQVGYRLDDPAFPDFPIMRTFSGWWSDVAKVLLLIEAFKKGMRLKQAWVHAGITKKQWRAFIDIHPDFNTLRKACQTKAKFPSHSYDPNLLLYQADYNRKEEAKWREKSEKREAEIRRYSARVERIVGAPLPEASVREQDLMIVPGRCPFCRRELTIALTDTGQGVQDLTASQVKIARKNGAVLQRVITEDDHVARLANVCDKCNAPIENELLLTDFFVKAQDEGTDLRINKFTVERVIGAYY